MKKSLSTVFILTLSMIVGTFAVRAQAAGPDKKMSQGAPKNDEIVHAIILNQGVSLGGDVSCQGAWTDLPANTIGDYFSALVAASISPDFAGSKFTISSASDTWGKAKAPGWKCELSLRDDDPEVLWNRGIVFFMKASDRSAVKESFRCPGAP
jgi:hypothetical protein